MVRLARLRLKNLRSYEAADLSFPAGTTLLVGDVGSGKTSILYAIEMALFGFAEVDPTFLVRHRAPEAEVRLELASGEHTYEFARRFRRKTRRGREVLELESASYAEDGQRASYSVTEIRERAIRLLGFPDNPNPRAHSDLWRWAVYVPQEQMREVLAQEPEQRLETVRKALGLEQYRTAAENAQLLATELRRSALAREETAHAYDHDAAVVAEMGATLDERRAALKASEAKRAEAAANAEVAERALADIEVERERLEKARAEEAEVGEGLRALAEQRSRSEERARTRAAETARLDGTLAGAAGRSQELATTESEARHVAAELESSAARRRVAMEALEQAARLEGAVAAARGALDLSERSLADASAALVAAQRSETAAGSEGPQREPPAPTPRTIGELEQSERERQRELEEAAREEARRRHVLEEVDELLAQGVCPRCHQTVVRGDFATHRAEAEEAVGAAHAVAEARRAEVTRLAEERRARERYERVRQRWEEVLRLRAAAREQVERERHRVDEATSRRDEARAGLDTAEHAVAGARAGVGDARAVLEVITTLERRRNELSAQVERARPAVEADRLATSRRADLAAEASREVAEREELAARWAALEARRRALLPLTVAREELLARLQPARNAARAAREAEALAARESARLAALLETAELRIAEARRRLEQQARLLAESARRRTMAEWLADEFRPAVLQLERRLLLRAQSEFERGFAAYFTMLVEDPALVARCDPSFSPSVEIDGEWTPVEALSGGERTALALAYRLALAGVVRSAGRLALELLILDEPTDGFSPEQVLRMGELLERLALPQVLLVSHEGQLAAVADRVVRVEKKDGRSVLRPSDDGAATEPLANPEEPSAAPVTPRRRRVRSPHLDAPPSEASTSKELGPPE